MFKFKARLCRFQKLGGVYWLRNGVLHELAVAAAAAAAAAAAVAAQRQQQQQEQMARAHGKSAAADHTGAYSLKDTETDCPLSVVHVSS